MATSKDAVVGAARRKSLRFVGQGLLAVAAVAVTAGSAILVKEMQGVIQPLAVVERVSLHAEGELGGAAAPVILAAPEDDLDLFAAELESDAAELDEALLEYARDPEVRWFNGRPVRPARRMMMEVTAYSPGPESCAPFDDGFTATMHSVNVNAMKLVAADTDLLPFGSLVSVPGYDAGNVVPVLDRGGAIKGQKLDLMFPTHESALQWGRQHIEVTVWEYADGLPPDDPRRFR